jgi:hypothetical protein
MASSWARLPLLLLLLPTWPYLSSKRRQQESNMTKLSILYSAVASGIDVVGGCNMCKATG